MRIDKRQDVVGFRSDVRALIAAQAPRTDVRDGLRVPADATEETALRTWYRSLFDAGLLGGGWPERWGGDADHEPHHDTVVMEELIRARAPRPLDQTLLAAHCLLAFGTDQQQASYLPRIRGAEDVWCQLFSEPAVGSDLAALTTRARADGDGFRVTGQKVWTTDAQWAQMGVLLARTDPTARLHAGITAFLLPMDAPGVEVRPLREMTGFAEFCEVFLDDVAVGPDQVLGKVGEGWRIVASGLASERGYVGASSVQLEVMMADLVALARAIEIDGEPAIGLADVRHRIASLDAEVAAARTSAARATSALGAGVTHGSEALVAKLTYTELNVRLCHAALDLVTASTGPPDALAERLTDNWFHSLLWSRALTISGGSSEIIRSLIAQQMLDLPRSWSRAG